MAYRIEQEPNGKTAIVIDGFDTIASNPYSGMNKMFQVNLETQGEVSLGYPITANTVSGATLGQPIARSTRFFTYGTPGVPASSPQSFAILDAGGQVFEATSMTGTFSFLSSSNSTTGSTANDGCVYWMGFLFKTRGANIDYWDNSTWHTGWQTTLTSGVKHFMYVGTDNVLYITNGNYLASITAPSPTAFDPGTGSTFAFAINKLQLPVNDMALSLAEVGTGNSGNSTLLIGGQFNAIYPWDKRSPSFALPIYIGDNYIYNMISVNQNALIFPGGGVTNGGTNSRGRIYITNGSQAEVYYKIPDYIFGFQDPYYVWGDAMFHRNQLVFSFLLYKNDENTAITLGEVFAIDLQTKAFRSISSLPSGNGAATCLIPQYNLSSKGFGYILASWDTSTAAIGNTNSNAGTGGTYRVITDLIPVGTILNKSTFAQVEYKLRSPIQSGESITFTPIVDTASVTSLSFVPAIVNGTTFSQYAPINFQGAQWLQLDISATGNNMGSGVRLHEIRIRQ